MLKIEVAARIDFFVKENPPPVCSLHCQRKIGENIENAMNFIRLIESKLFSVFASTKKKCSATLLTMLKLTFYIVCFHIE